MQFLRRRSVERAPKRVSGILRTGTKLGEQSAVQEFAAAVDSMLGIGEEIEGGMVSILRNA